MRAFFSPGERSLLETLPPNEADVVRALMVELDARLVEDPAPLEQGALFDVERLAA